MPPSLRRKIRKLGDRALERNFGGDVLEPSIFTLEIIKDAAEAIDVPILTGVAGILLTILKAVKNAKTNMEGFRMLAERAGHIVLAINEQVSGVAVSPQFRSNITQLESILKDIQLFVCRHMRVHPLSQIFHSGAMTELVCIHNKRLDDAIQLFQVETLVMLRAQTEQDALILHRVEAGIADIQDVLDKTERSVQEFEGIPLLRWEEINLDEEIRIRRGYRIHTASYHGRIVIAKVFEGAHATRDWVCNAKFNHSLRHPNILQVIGISSPSSEPSVILFNGGIQNGHRDIESLIASALRTELARSVKLGIRLIHGLATGLDYLRSQGILLSSIGLENFDILIGADDKVRISFNIGSTPKDHTPNDSYSSLTRSSDDEDWAIFNDLCRKTLETANYLLYKERVKREAFSGLPPLVPTMSPMFQKEDSIQESFETMPEKSHSPISPRREFVWMVRSRGNTSLADVARRFGEYAEISSCSLASLRRIVAPKTPEAHDCPGYLREEITLTTSIGDSAIVFHTTPTQREVCIVCGCIVSYRNQVESETILRGLALPEFDDEVPHVWIQEGQVTPAAALSDSVVAFALEDGEQAYRCDMPGCMHMVAFPRRSAVISHIRSVHLQEQPFRCTTCNMTFRRKRDAERHIQYRNRGKLNNKVISVSDCFRGGILSLVSTKYVSLPDLIRRHDYILEYLSSLALQ